GTRHTVGLAQHGQSPLAEVAPAVAREIDLCAADIDLPYIKENLGRLIARTRDGVERVARIVHSLRGLARSGKAQRQVCSVADLIESSLEMVRNHFRKHKVQIETKYDPDCSLSCVASQLSQVFLNLLVNAAQAIEAAQESQPTRSDGHWIKVHVRRLEDEMLIQVADSGCGIAPENLMHIFDPFFTTKDVGE